MPDTRAKGGQNIRALNHFNVSLYKIAHYNNKAVLDEEYSTIVNDINLAAIGDQKLLGIIQSLMDALTRLKLEEAERSRMETMYQRMQQDLLLLLMYEGGNGLDRGVVAGASLSLGLAAGAIASLPSLATSVIKPFMAAREMRLALEDFDWELEKKKLEELNTLNKTFLAAYWEFLHTSGTPDSLRISEGQIATLLEACGLKNPGARWRTLVRLEGECGAIPGYWYYRADAAHDLFLNKNDGNEAEKMRLAADIRECLRRYQEEEALLRKDKTLASLIMLYLTTTPVSASQAREEIGRIVEAFPLDPSKRLFAALICLQHGLADEAAEHLQTNLDMEQYAIVSRKLLADIYEEKHDEEKIVLLLRKALKEERASNQEILQYLGKLTKAEMFLKEFEPQIAGITLRIVSSVMGMDTLELVLPHRWELAGHGATVLTVDGQKLESAEKKEEEGVIIIVFPRMVKEKELAAKGEVPVSARIETGFAPLTLEGRLTFLSSKGSQKSPLSGLMDYTANIIGIGRGEATFTLQKLACGDCVLKHMVACGGYALDTSVWAIENRNRRKTPKTWNEAEEA